MAKRFNELRRKMPPARRARNAAEANRVLLEMSLQELRRGSTELSQKDVADMLRVTQGYVSKLERQPDMLLSRLYEYVEALGGEVEIRAKLPGREIKISQFRELDKLRRALVRKRKPRTTAA